MFRSASFFRNRLTRALVAACFAALLLSSCYVMRPSHGGGQTRFTPPRKINPADVAVPDGYTIEPLAAGLTFPTGVAFDGAGRAHVIESGYAYGEVWTTPRLLRIEPGGTVTEVAHGRNNGPWTGLTWHDGAFYIAEGGQMLGGAILRITPEGEIKQLVDGLPGKGDHHTNGVRVGPDGMLYFSQGTATNSGVVGEDNAQFGWLKRFPDFHDTPGQDITLAGLNFETKDPLRPGNGNAVTGAFLPFGTASKAGEVIRGAVPCNGAVMRMSLDGGPIELVAWGFRNPFGMAFAPDGTLYVTDNMYDVRGSRPVFGTGDLLWAVKPGLWYGWPDFHGGKPLNRGRDYAAPGKAAPRFLLASHPNPPPKPAAILGVHASADGLDFSTNPEFGYAGQAFIAEFGDQAPVVGKTLEPVGFKVVRVEPATGVIQDFAVNRKANGPASLIGGGGLERPVAVRFTPDGRALYVVDFGVMLEHGKKSQPFTGTGVVWKISKSE